MIRAVVEMQPNDRRLPSCILISSYLIKIHIISRPRYSGRKSGSSAASSFTGGEGVGWGGGVCGVQESTEMRKIPQQFPLLSFLLITDVAGVYRERPFG